MFGEIRAYRNAGVERLQVQRASSSLPAFTPIDEIVMLVFTPLYWVLLQRSH